MTLVEAYEEKHYHTPMPDPIEAILSHVESRGMSRRDLEPFIGSRARVSEALNRKLPLSMEMVRNLRRGLGIPADVLIQPYGQGSSLIPFSPGYGLRSKKMRGNRLPSPLSVVRPQDLSLPRTLP